MDKVYMDEVYGVYMNYLNDFTHKTDNQTETFLKLTRLLAERGNYLEKAISMDDWVGAVLLVRGLSEFTQPTTSELNRVTNELLYHYLERYVQNVPDDRKYDVSLGLLRDLDSILTVEFTSLEGYDPRIDDYIYAEDTYGDNYIVKEVSIYFLRDLLDKSKRIYLSINAKPKHQSLLYLGTPFKQLLLSVPNLKRELSQFSIYELSFKVTEFVELFPSIIEKDTEQIIRVIKRLVSNKEPLLDIALKDIFKSEIVPKKEVINVGNTLNAYNLLEELNKNKTIQTIEQVRTSYLGILGLGFNNNSFNVKNMELMIGHDLKAYAKRRERFISNKLSVLDNDKFPTLQRVKTVTLLKQSTRLYLPTRELHLSNQSKILFTPSSMIFIHVVKGNIAQSLIFTQDVWSTRLSLSEHLQEFEKIVRSKVSTNIPYTAIANQIYDLRRR